MASVDRVLDRFHDVAREDESLLLSSPAVLAIRVPNGHVAAGGTIIPGGSGGFYFDFDTSRSVASDNAAAFFRELARVALAQAEIAEESTRAEAVE